tara:strand:+ start:373 stop:657 length:285 start_codon:yes stop_codon:yes gene_type:complete
MGAYAPEGEMMLYDNPRAFLKDRKVTALGETTTPLQALGGAGTIALGMIYFGMGFPGSKTVIDWTKKRIEQPYETTQYAFLGIGSAILISRAYK